MPTLFLMCGLPGSGKTTLAKQLERERFALRLTPDEWIADFAFDPYDEGKRAIVESIQWSIALRLLELGANVVLDFGVWSRRERDEFRAGVAKVGATTELRFLDVPHDELRRRLTDRRGSVERGAFPVDDEQLDQYLRVFEIPTPDEFRADAPG